MPRDYKVYLEDIVEAIRKIRFFTTGLSLQTFSSDVKTFDAVIRNLEIIGEAIKRVPEEIRLIWRSSGMLSKTNCQFLKNR
jgi:uncharacterized protein with HEPN domain